MPGLPVPEGDAAMLPCREKGPGSSCVLAGEEKGEHGGNVQGRGGAKIHLLGCAVGPSAVPRVPRGRWVLVLAKASAVSIDLSRY